MVCSFVDHLFFLYTGNEGFQLLTRRCVIIAGQHLVVVCWNARSISGVPDCRSV